MEASFPAAIPWYRSTVLRGVLTIAATQFVGRLQTRYHIDTSVVGLGVNDIVSWAMDAISAGALAYMARNRVTQKASPVITATKAAADQMNTDNPVGVLNVKTPPAPGSDPPPSV